MKKFIDPRKATKFQLVYRSQRDITITDENSSEMVLKEIPPSFNILKKHSYQPMQDFEQESVADDFDVTNYGVYFNDVDEYDYKQHLKPINETNFVGIDPLVFGGKEQEIGLPNQPIIDYDPFNIDENVRQALEALDDEAYVEECDDYFDELDSEQVSKEYEKEEQQGWLKDYSMYKKNINSESDSDSNATPKRADTSYSMSSSSLFRNDKLTLLDDRFDKILEEYEEEEIGELDPEDPDVLGHFDFTRLDEETARLDSIFNEFLDSTKLNATATRLLPNDSSDQVLDEIRTELRENVEIEKYDLVEEGCKETIPIPFEPKKDTWDVETVLTGYSNIYNRPKLLVENSKKGPQIILKGRNKMPTILHESESSEEEADDEVPKVNKGKSRPVNESKQEKKDRKKAVKEEKRQQRSAKKATKTAFKKEGLLQQKLSTNHAMQSMSFASIGIIPELCQACEKLGYKEPTEIQSQSIPIALQGRDIIGLAQTGSGKTAAFALPIIQKLFENPQPLFCCVMAPTRELAVQISEQFEALGSTIGVKSCVIVGGMDMMSQQIALTKKPHIVVCTPGRLVDHLEHTKGFNLKQLKYLVLDEADRLLDLDFGAEIEKVLKVIPRERNTFLFSATMTTKVEKLQRASLVNPCKIEVAQKYSTVDSLLQYYLFFPFKYKECYLVYLMNELVGHTVIVFTLTVASTQKLALMLRNLGFEAICLHGQMPQPKRLGALAKFKSGQRTILIATDVASRGLDIPSVDIVINYDVPQSSKDYIHRVGRTARAGRSGKSITFVTQYDIEWYQRVEHALQKKLPEYPIGQDKSAVLLLQERVSEAVRFAHLQLKEENMKKKHKRDEEKPDDEESTLKITTGGKKKRRK